MKKINVLSLFDGIGMAHQALKDAKVPINKYYSSEVDKNAITVSNSNHEQVNLGNVMDLKFQNNEIYVKNELVEKQEIDLLIGGSPCFIAGTKILTNLGYKNIEDIKIGDMVLSHTGKWRKVLNVGGKDFAPTRILNSYGCIGVETTDEHPFYVRKLTKKWNSEIKKSTRNFSEPNWIEAKELVRNDYCSMVKTCDLNIENGFNEMFWYMIGRYTGDGWYRETKRKNRKNSFIYQFIICCGIKEFEELKEHFDNFGYNYNFSKERTVYKFRVCSQSLVNFVKEIGVKAHNKRVHPLLFQEKLENKKAFLNGYFDSDGYFNEKIKIQTAKSTSYDLLLGIQKLIIDVYERPVAFTYNELPSKCVIEGRIVNQRSSYSISFKEKRLQDKAFFENIFAWIPVKSNNVTNERKTVYNLEVDIDNSYTANNIVVHNCTNLSFAGKQAGLKTKCNQDILTLEDYLSFKNNGFEFEGQSFLFWEYIRILRELKPKYFFLENVVMEEKWEKIFTENLGVEPIKLNSKLFTCQNRPRLYWTNIPYNKIEIPDLNLKFKSIKENSNNKKHYYSDKAIQWLVNHSYRKYEKTGKIKKLKIYNDEDIINAITASHCKKYSGQRFFAILDNGIDNTIQKNKIKEIFDECSKLNNFTKLEILTDWKKILYEGYSYRYITPEECELAQGLPKNYTSFISDTARYKAIGNGFTVDVISWFLKFIKKY